MAAARAAATSALAALTAAAAFAGSASAAPTWSLDEHPAPPRGADFRVPLGAPGDLQFWAPNRGLLAVEGNAAVGRGLYVWNGRAWRQLSTVCGGPSDTTRIAWAGPTEFWTVTVPSLPRQGSGLGLCHFKDGEVVASYSTAEQAADPYRRMNAAACASPSSCWFAGIGTADPTNEREGSFHLRWEGAGLRTVYFPQGRGVSDVEAFGDRFYETTFVGARAEGRTTPARLRAAEDRPRLIHRLLGGSIASEPFSALDVADPDPSDAVGPPVDATDLLALDAGADTVWAVGGGTASGALPPGGGANDVYPRGPIVARLVDGVWRELPLRGATFAADERFVDVAAVPGSDRAWVAVQRFADRRSATARGKVARIAPDGTVEEVLTLPQSGSGRGAIAKLAFTAPNEGWAVTTAGWVLHYDDGSWTSAPADDAEAFGQLIDFRPNEAAAQFVPDSPPVDDSRLLAPPPLEIEQTAPPAEPVVGEAEELPPLLAKVKSRLRGRTRLVISFTLVRRARIGITGRRKGKVVARLRTKTYTPGKRKLVVKLDPKRYPTRLAFQIRELDVETAPEGAPSTGAGDVVTTR